MTTNEDVESERLRMVVKDDDGACVVAFYRAFVSFDANSLYKRCECECKRESVCV